MIQLLLGLTFFALFVIVIFACSVSVPVYALITRGRWAWTVFYAAITFVWLWGMQHFLTPDVADATVSDAEAWWNAYWWITSLVFYQVIGVVLGVAVVKQWSPSRAILGPVLAGILVLGAAIATIVAIAPTYLGQDVRTFITTELQDMVRQSIAYYEAANIPQDQLAMLKEVGGQMTEGFSFALLPALMWIMALATTMLTLFLGKWLVPRQLWMKYQGGLTRWKTPGVCVWLVILLGAAYFVDFYVIRVPLIMPIIANSLLALAGLFLLQGAFIVAYYIRRQRDGIFRWIWYGLIVLFFQTALVVMVVLGLFDYWIDFRRIEKRS